MGIVCKHKNTNTNWDLRDAASTILKGHIPHEMEDAVVWTCGKERRARTHATTAAQQASRREEELRFMETIRRI